MSYIHCYSQIFENKTPAFKQSFMFHSHFSYSTLLVVNLFTVIPTFTGCIFCLQYAFGLSFLSKAHLNIFKIFLHPFMSLSITILHSLFLQRRTLKNQYRKINDIHKSFSSITSETIIKTINSTVIKILNNFYI